MNTATAAARRFAQARQLTTWHYHWLVLHEFLPQIVGQAMVDDVLRNGRRFYKPRMREGFIPVEFQTGAYRFGHSMVRPSYRANLAGDNGNPFFGMVFDPAGDGQPDPVDLRGGARGPGASSAGRRSSTSATATSSRTNASTRESRRLCSSFRSGRSRAMTSRKPCRSGTSYAS